MTASDPVSTRRCPYCNKDHPVMVRFCPTTGEILPEGKLRRCPRCKSDVREYWTHCDECGYEMPVLLDDESVRGRLARLRGHWLIKVFGAALGLVILLAGCWFLWLQVGNGVIEGLITTLQNAQPTAPNAAVTVSVVPETPTNTPKPTATLPPLPTETRHIGNVTPTRFPTATPSPTPSQTPTPTALSPVFDWRIEVVQEENSVGYFSALAVDAQDRLHVVYLEDNRDIIRHARTQVGVWLFDNVAGGQESGFNLALALDLNGSPVIGFRMKGKKIRPELRFVTYDQGKWDLHRLVGTVSADTDISMALGKDGMPHFSYLDAQENTLMYAHFAQNKGWVFEVIDQPNAASQTFPMVVDAQGRAHFVYQSHRGALLYAVRSGQTVDQLVVHAGGQYGKWSALAVDPEGRPHIAYTDDASQALMYATLEEQTWVRVVVDGTGAAAEFPAIAVGSNGEIYISYYDAAHPALKFAHGRGGHWDLYEVDNRGDSGQYNSLVLDSKDTPHISYLEATNADLMLATGVRQQP